MRQSTCTMPDCNNKHEAKGLCHKHYARSRPRPADKQESVNCDACGTTYARPKRAADRWANSYCSFLCRGYDRFGPRFSELPKDHMARCIGMTCEWKPAFVPIPTDCAWCGSSMTPVSSRNKFCTPGCKKRQQKATRRGREHNAIGTYSWTEIVRLWVAFNKTCAYCTNHTPLEQIQAEHVVPLSRGGANNLTNLLPSCRLCNGDKRDLLLSEWNADRKRRGLTPVKTTWHAADPRYRHLVTTGQLAA